MRVTESMKVYVKINSPFSFGDDAEERGWILEGKRMSRRICRHCWPNDCGCFLKSENYSPGVLAKRAPAEFSDFWSERL